MSAEEGDRVRVGTNRVTYEGVLMPSTTGHTVIKLDNGYNVGVNKGARIELIEKRSPVVLKGGTKMEGAQDWGRARQTGRFI